MAENYYDDGGDQTPQGDSNKDKGAQTALIPKSLCPGMQPGDSVTLKIDKAFDDDFQVSYPGHHSQDEESETDADETDMEPAPVPDRGNYD
jgi:hypothetical protein